MAINPSDAATTLQEIAAVERRTRQAFFYSGSSAIFILWGLLIICAYALAALEPRSAGTVWLVSQAIGCAVTVGIIAARTRAQTRSGEKRDWRIIWALLALMIFGAAWAQLLGPIVPRRLIETFEPSLFFLGLILAGLWLGRAFFVLGLAGMALTAAGSFQSEPWLSVWMAVVQGGTYILGGLWLHKNGVSR